MKEKIPKIKEKVLKTYPLKIRHTLKTMSKKFRRIDNYNLSFKSRHTLKIMSTGSEKTRKLKLFSQIPESYLEKNRFKSISQNPGEILRQFSRINEKELSLYTEILTKTVKVIPEESPHILIK
jgi:hypothetical protein